MKYEIKELNTNNEAQNYISLVDDTEFYKFLEINQKQIYFKNNFNHKMNYYFDSKNIKKIKYNKILMVGPLSNIELENFNGYDLLVFNKIPSEYIIDLNIPIIICTGNLWMKTNYKKISQLVYKHNNISVFSTTKSKITNNKENIIYSTRIHDYFMNFIFVKNFLSEHDNFKGEIREIVHKDYNSICKLLHKFYYE